MKIKEFCLEKAPFHIFHFSLFTFNCYSQWFSQPSGTKANLHSVSFTDSNHGWAVGNGGTILRYNGKQWLKQNSGTTVTINSVSFTDSTHGWAVGNSGIILKYNGKLWSKQKSGTTQNLYSVCFTDSLHGWTSYRLSCVGGFLPRCTTQILKYNGKQWNANPNQTLSIAAITSICFRDSINGWAVGYNINDLPGGSPYSSIFFYNGNSWTNFTYNYSRINLLSVYSRDSNFALAVGMFGCGDCGTPFLTSYLMIFNGSWIKYDSSSKFLSSVYYTDNKHIWEVGDSGVIVNYNGKFFNTQISNTKYNLSSVYFTDSLNGWAVGNNGTILHTTKGGVIEHHSIQGKITYDNQYNTPIQHTKVYLKNYENIITDSTVTDTTGFYIFTNVENGNYSLQPIITLQRGGVDPTDALLINHFYVHISTIGDLLMKQAADVNADNKINPVDALLINRRYVNLIHSFKAGNWVWNNSKILVGGQNVINDIKVLCTGDVKGTYIPK